MKAYYLIKLSVLLPLLLCTVQANCATQSVQKQIQALASEGSRSNFPTVKIEVESLWTNNPVLYFQCENQLEIVLATIARTNFTALQEVEKEAQQALNRNCPTNPLIAGDCFDAKLQIAECLIHNSSTFSVSNALALAAFLGEVRTTMITNYQPLEVTANVMPPLMPTNKSGMGYFSGMPPYAIADPVARSAYEKAITDNGDSEKKNTFQTYTLPEINRTLSQLFLSYTRNLFALNSETKIEADNLGRVAHLTQRERQSLQAQ